MIRQSVGGRYIGLQAHIMEARMDHRDQAVTNKTENPKGTKSVSDLEMASLILGWIVLE